jgi:hypothetical protein
VRGVGGLDQAAADHSWHVCLLWPIIGQTEKSRQIIFARVYFCLQMEQLDL